MPAFALAALGSQIIRTAAYAVQMVGTRRNSKIVQTQPKRGYMNGLNFAVEITVSLCMWQAEIKGRLGASQFSLSNSILNPPKPFISRCMTVSVGVPGVFSAHPACLQLGWQTAFVGKVIQPVPELMCGHLAQRTISFADAEPFEGGPAASASAVTAGEEVRELADGHWLNEQRVSVSV